MILFLRRLCLSTERRFANACPFIIQAALLRDAREEGRGLACVRSALSEVKKSQTGVLDQVEDLQNALGLLSFTSGFAPESTLCMDACL